MRVLSLAVVNVWLAGCGVLTHARPTPKGTLAVELAAGGPMASLGGVPVPLPLSAVGASYGISERCDVQAHTHLTTLLLFRTFGFDAGGTCLLLDQEGWRPAVAASARGYAFTDFRSGVLPYADGSLTGSYRLGGWALAYLTATLMLDYQGRAAFSPALGGSAELGPVTLQLELRWYDPGYDAGPAVAPWVSPGGRGAIGLIVGVAYPFGPAR